MKILLINYRYFISGGPERYLFNVKEMLEKEGHLVIPFSVKSKKNVKSLYEDYFAEPMGGQDESYFDKAKITPKFLLDLISRLFYSLHVKRKLKTLIQEKKPDVAYVLHHYNKLSPSVIDACKSEGLSVYVRLSDYFILCPQAHFLRKGRSCDECLTNGLYKAILGRCVKKSFFGSLLKVLALIFHRNILSVYNCVDGFVCTTEFMKNMMIRGGWNRSLLHVIPTLSVTSDSKKSDVIPEPIIHNPFILYFGRFSYEKGVDLLVNAYEKSSLPNRGIKLVLAGGDKLEFDQVFSDSISANTSLSNIEIVGRKTGCELRSLVKAAMFVVVPSRWYENMPNTVIEAYSCSKPVVAMNIGSMPEIVIDGITGLLFEQESCLDLREKLDLLSTDEQLLRKLSNNAFKFCGTHMSAEVHIKRLISLFSTNN